MISYLLSKPDGWKTMMVDLKNRATNGRDSVQSIMKELIEERWDRDKSEWVTRNIFLFSDLKEIEESMKPEKKQ